MTEVQEEKREIELLDLGDATIETKQWGVLPQYYDSVFLLGDKDWT